MERFFKLDFGGIKMNFVEMIPILLPIFLFIVSMIITFTLFYRDRKEIRIGSVKKLIDNYVADIESSKKMLDDSVTSVEEKVAGKNEESKTILGMVGRQLEEVKSYSGDLIEIKKAMINYKKTLQGLAGLSQEAKAFTLSIHEDIARAEQVDVLIKAFMQSAKEADEHLEKHKKQVAEIQDQSIEDLKEYVRKIDRDLDGFMEGLNREGEDLLDSFKQTENAEVNAGLKKLDDSFHVVIKTVKEFMGALDEKCIALENTSDLITSSSADTLEQISVRSKELKEMSLSLSGAREERDKILKELEELKEEKHLLQSFLNDKENPDEEHDNRQDENKADSLDDR